MLRLAYRMYLLPAPLSLGLLLTGFAEAGPAPPLSPTVHASGPPNVGLSERTGECGAPPRLPARCCCWYDPAKRSPSLLSPYCAGSEPAAPPAWVEKMLTGRDLRCAGGVLVRPTCPPYARCCRWKSLKSRRKVRKRRISPAFSP